MLASLLGSSDDIGPSSRPRVTQLMRETHWLAELLQAYDETQSDAKTMPPRLPTELLRLDSLVGEVVQALQLTEPATVLFVPHETWTLANRLALWRALRNVMDNALRAVGAQGMVRVRVAVEDATAVVEVDDDGPGLGNGPAGLDSLGLPIVRDVLAEHGGGLATSTSDLGGGRVRLMLPAIHAPDQADRPSGGQRRAGTDL